MKSRERPSGIPPSLPLAIQFDKVPAGFALLSGALPQSPRVQSLRLMLMISQVSNAAAKGCASRVETNWVRSKIEMLMC